MQESIQEVGVEMATDRLSIYLMGTIQDIFGEIFGIVMPDAGFVRDFITPPLTI